MEIGIYNNLWRENMINKEDVKAVLKELRKFNIISEREFARIYNDYLHK